MVYPPLWPKRRGTRHIVAFHESTLFGARVQHSGGSWSIQHLATRGLPADLVSVSPVTPNVESVSELARLSELTLRELGGRGGRVGVILPDLAVRAFPVRLDGKLRAHDLLGRVAARLPFPRSEAVFDVWKGSSKTTLVAAVRRAVLEQYQQALEAVGSNASWIDAASLILIPAWIREAAADLGNGDAPLLRVHVQLYPRHFSMAVVRQGELTDFRVKLGGASDSARLVDELRRLPSMTGGGPIGEITLRGEGAAPLTALVDGAAGAGSVHCGENGAESHFAALALAMARRM